MLNAKDQSSLIGQGREHGLVTTLKKNQQPLTTEMGKNPCESFYSKPSGDKMQPFGARFQDEQSVIISELDKDLSF